MSESFGNAIRQSLSCDERLEDDPFDCGVCGVAGGVESDIIRVGSKPEKLDSSMASQSLRYRLDDIMSTLVCME